MLSVPSPDGKQVAYGWYNKEDFCDLRIVGSDGSNPPVLYAGAKLLELDPKWCQDADERRVHRRAGSCDRQASG